MMTPDEASELARQRLRELADQDEVPHPSPLVEQHVMAVWDERQSARRTPPVTLPRVTWALAAALAFVVGGATALGLWWQTRRSSDAAIPSASVAPMPPSMREAAIPPVSTFVDDDPSSLQIVRMWTDTAALRNMGLPLSAPESETPIALELVLRADGTAASARLLGAIEDR